MCAVGANETDPAKWLETPTDLQCTTASTNCLNVTPVFFDTTRLAKITATAWDGAAYKPLDTWTFTQRFVGEGDDGSVANAASVSLRLESVQRTGFGGLATGVALPKMAFSYVALANRVDSPTDGQSALWRHRVIQVRTEAGGTVNVGYRAPDCTATTLPATTDPGQSANTKLCYLVRWQPEHEVAAHDHWFHKYVVESIVEDGGASTGSLSKATRYTYGGGAKWVKPTGPLVKAAEATYSEFRGFAQVETSLGEGTAKSVVERTVYFRGTGATLSAGPSGGLITSVDREEYTGQVFNSQQLNSTVKVSETVNQPAVPVVTATDPSGVKATRIPAATTYGFLYTAAGAVARRTSSTTTNDTTGLPVQVEDRGDLAVTTDDVCTKTTYRRDSTFTAANKLSFPEKTERFGALCAGTLSSATLISRDQATYDTAGRPTETRAVNPADAAADVVTGKTSYDAAGRPLTQTDAAGNVTTIAYATGAGGQLSKVTTTSPDPDGTGPLAAFVSSQTFNPLTGLAMASTDPNGLVTTTTYDALGRVLSVRKPEHTGATRASVEYAYTVADTGVNSVTTKTLGADGKDQQVSVVLYDGMGRPFQSQVEAADSRLGASRMVEHAYYDSTGRAVRSIAPWWVKGLPATSVETPPATPLAQTTLVYDKAGRLTDEVLWAGTDSNAANEERRTKTVYDGASTLTIPPIGGVPTETLTDARGNVTSLTEYLRDPDTQATAITAATVKPLVKQTTTYAYDAAGQLKSMTNPAGDIWSYTYDLAGRQTTATDPDSGLTKTSYDLLGRVVTSTNAKNQVLAYTYDALSRKTSLRDGSVTGTIRSEWTYDGSDLPDGKSALGQLTTETRVVDGKEYSTGYPVYDSAYRPLKVDTALAVDSALLALSGQTYSTEMTYTADGQVSQLTYPAITDAADKIVLGAETVTTRYDAATSMPDWMSGGFGWGAYVADTMWGADGKLEQLDLGNTYAAHVGYTWDQITQQLTGIRLSREGVDAPEVNLAYGYDTAGNVTSMVDNAAGQVDAQCFRYDGLARLQVAWTDSAATCAAAAPTATTVGGVAPYWTEYDYDALGNRTAQRDKVGTVSTTAYVHGAGAAGPHQLTSMTKSTGSTAVATAFTYDASGNQASRTTGGVAQTQTWDAEGELTAVTSGGKTASNVFDASGNRLVKTDAGGVTVYLPGGQEVHATSAGVEAKRWYSFAGQVVAVRTGAGMGAVSSIVADAHGTPVAQVHNTNWPGSVTRIRTDPFGAARTGQAGNAFGHGFLGAPADASGFTLLGARFYDPVTGRFLSVDPVMAPTDPAQWNAYSYAHNSPVTFADPSGLRPDESGASTRGYTWRGSQGWQAPAPTKPPTPSVLVGGGVSVSQWVSAAGKVLAGTLQMNVLTPGIDIVNQLASFGNALMQNPASGLEMLSGIGGVFGGISVMGGGAAACLTGIGCLSTPAAEVAGAGMVVAGAGLAGHGMGTLMREANGGSRVEPLQRAEGEKGPAPTTVEEALDGLPRGKSSSVRTVASDRELEDLHAALTRGGTPLESPRGYRGSWVERQDGIVIGLREESKSGGRTIDIRFLDGSTGKVHIK